MKIALIFLIALLFIGCRNPKPQSYPQWYKHRKIHSNLKYEIVGYGQGKTIKEAKSNAKEDIAETLISRVNSSITSETTGYNDTFTDKIEARLKITSKVHLHNLETIKQEQFGDLFYVALKYKNLDLANRIKNTIGNFKCDDKQHNNYLSQTPLIKKLTASIGCPLNFKLDRKNEAWYLEYKEDLFLLSDSEFEALYFTRQNNNFTFLSNKKVFTDGDRFYFKLSSKQKGYITLLDVYENGIVTVIQSSTPIKNTLQIPSKNSKNYFEAGLVKDNMSTYDLYVAIYTKNPLDMSRFEYANEDLAKNELSYKFDELLSILNGTEYSTILIRTISK